MPEIIPQKLNCKTLFIGFFQAGIIGFGGVLPVARRMIVDQRKWLSQSEFNELFALCQFMPGANIVNFSFAFGARHGGVSGAAAAVLGLLGAPMAIIMILAGFYAKFGTRGPVRHALAGLAAAAVGLVLGTAFKIAAPIVLKWRNLLIAIFVFGLVALAKLTLPLAMLIALPVSFIVAWCTP